MVRGSFLSDEELAVFGVERNRNKDGKRHERYTIHCDICGKPFEISIYNTNKVYKCQECRKKHIEIENRIERLLKEKIEHEEAEEVGIDYEHYQRFESAARNFGIKYYCAIEQASAAMKKFGSVPEAMACIELLYIGARVIPQAKIGRYKVDFCLPDYKMIVEIDGALYHQDPNKEYWRDAAIQKTLGDDWVIKHIPAESLKNNHSLFGKSMKRLLDKRKLDLNI